MGVLRKPRYELFAQGLAQGLSQTKAAIEAGFAESDAAARGCRLAKRPEIKARVQELRPRIAKQTEITTNISKAWMIERLQAVREKAMAENQLATAAKCVMDIGKVAGVYIEKTENTEYVALAQLLITGDLAGVSDEQLEQLHRLISQLGGTKQKAISANESRPSSASRAVVDVVSAAEIPPVENKESWL